VPWSKAVCAALRKPGPTSLSRVTETLASDLAAGPLFGYLFFDLLDNLHLDPQHQLDLE
jgi:hypothetical protein